MRARSSSSVSLTTSAADRPDDDMRMSSGPSRLEREAALGLVELHRRDADVEHDAVDRRDALLLRRPRSSSREARFDDGQPVAELILQRLRAEDGARIAIERQHAAFGGFENGARIAAGAERCVDVGARRLRGRRLATTSESSTGMWRARPGSVACPWPAARRHPRAPSLPSSSSEDERFPAPKSFRVWWTFSRARSRRSAKRCRLPHLKLVAKADKSDLGREAGVRAKPLRKADAAVAVDREDLDVAVERDRQLIALVRIVRQAREKPIDLFCKSLAASIESRSFERGVAVDAAGASSGVAVAFENGAERSAGLRPGLWRRSCL